MSRFGKVQEKYEGRPWQELVVTLKETQPGPIYDQIVLAIWAPYEREMEGYLERRGAKPQDVDDAMVETFRRLHKTAHALTGNPGAWIQTLLTRAYVDVLRQTPEEEVSIGGSEELLIAEKMALDSGLRATDPLDQFCNEHTQNPLDLMIAREERADEQVEAEAWFKATFSKIERDVFLARDEGLTYTQLAKQFRIPEQKVQDILKLVRRKISERWGGKIR